MMTNTTEITPNPEADALERVMLRGETSLEEFKHACLRQATDLELKGRGDRAYPYWGDYRATKQVMERTTQLIANMVPASQL